MARNTVKVEGLRELGEALKDLPKSAQKATLRRVLKKAAEPTQASWKAKVRPRRDTGHYEESIVIGTKLTRRQAKFAKKEGKSFSEIHVGTSDPAGVQDEFGNYRQPANPSARPAWEETQDQALKIIRDELGGEIEKTRARLARKAARLAAKG